MEKLSGNYFFIGKQLLDINDFDNQLVSLGTSVYEVIRFSSCKPLFLEDHFNRMLQSAKLLGVDLPLTLGEMKKLCVDIIGSNKLSEGNIKILYKFDSQINLESTVVCYLVSGYMPSEGDYNRGVEVESFFKARKLPNVKQTNFLFKKETDEYIKKNKLNDLILIDEKGFITEGSSSNVFFIKENSLFTSPQELVLKGITREKIVYICQKGNILLREEPVHISLIQSFEAMFLTSTSRSVLPVKRFDSNLFDPQHSLLRYIMNEYGNLLKESLIGLF